MRIEAIGPSNATAANRPPLPAAAPVVASTSSTVLIPTPAPELAGADAGVSYVSTIPATPPETPLAARIDRIAQLPIVSTVRDAAPVIAKPEVIPPAATSPTSVDQAPAINRDPTQAALAATAVAMSMLAPPPFGPSIIIPDEGGMNSVTSISAGTSTAAATAPETPTDPSLYALFQTAIVANGAAQAVDVVRRTIADLIPKTASPADAAPVA